MITEFSNHDYELLLQRSVAVLNKARENVARSVVSNINFAHWEVGKLLTERKLDSKYGAGVILRLSDDLKAIFPTMGLSPRNLWNMKSYYLRFYQSDIKLQQAVAVLPWGHILRLMSGFKDDATILYYAQETVKKNWSREMLVNAIKLEMHKSQATIKSPNNFDTTLPVKQANFANDVFKSTYNLGFLGVTEPILERELEIRLIERIKIIFT